MRTKKRFIYLVFFGTVLSFFSCGSKSTNSPGDESKKQKEKKSIVERDADTNSILGYYVGWFENADSVRDYSTQDNVITISIDSLNDRNLFGHSIVAGNLVPFVGSVEMKQIELIGDYYKVAKIVSTDADDKSKMGLYNFGIDLLKNRVEGTWTEPIVRMGASNYSYQLMRAYSLYDTEANSIMGKYEGKMKQVQAMANGIPKVYEQDITIYIDKLKDENKLLGWIRNGENRFDFRGTYEKVKVKYSVMSYTITDAKEVGNNKYNGTFNFTVDVLEKAVKGTWIANDKELEVTNCKFRLLKREFNYDPELEIDNLSFTEVGNKTRYNSKTHETELEMLTEDVAKFNASTTLLKESDIKNMYQGDLEVMRNAIYARHGYSFKNRRMRYVFSFMDWYMPVSVDVRNDLTEIEKKNIDLIKRYEEYADTYYDSFGR